MIDKSALVANLGAYYREHRDQIHTDMVFGLADHLTEQGIALMDGVSDEVPLINLDTEDVMQNGGDSHDWNPTADAVVIKNRTMKVRPAKVDLEIDVEDFERQWLTAMKTSQGRLSLANFPLYKFIFEKLNERINDNIRKSLWRSEYDAAPVTPSWATVHDGWVKKLTEDVTATNIIPVATGAITANNVLSKVEAVFDGWGVTYQNEPGVCHLTPEVYRWYTRLTEAQAGRRMTFDELSEGALYIRGSKVKIVSNYDLVSIGGIQPIVITKANNFVYATDSRAEANKMRFQEDKRIINVLVDWKLGVNYYLCNSKNSPIVTNDAFA